MIDTALVIGGGVIGLSTAYHLARKKVKKVILLDKGPIGSGSSSRAAGIITGLLWSETGVLVRKKSLALYRELSRDLPGYQFQDVGCLNLFDPESWPERQKLLQMYEALGAPFQILDAGEISEKWPDLHPPGEAKGLFDPLGGYSEPDEYIPAIARQCRQLGVEIRENEKVEEFILQNGAVTGVRTAKASLEADAVICSVYSWTLKLTDSLGIKWPIKVFVHQRYLTTPLPSPVRIPAVNAQHPLSGYVRPAAGKRILAGIESYDRSEFHVPNTDFQMSSVSADPELRNTLKKNFVSLLPALDKTTWDTEKVGLLTFSMDGEPIMGAVKQLPGFYLAVAFHSGGFAYNPAAGYLMAECVVDGRTSIDVTAFSPDRFDSGQVEEYLGSTSPQKDALGRRH